MPGIKVKKEKVWINNQNLTLEGCLEAPVSPGPLPGVILCHPHPLYGGDMNNYVIRILKRALHESNIFTLRFNFRGVGGSQGSFAAGVGEQEDALAAVAYLAGCPQADQNRLALAGYSFGGMVALAAGKKNPLLKAVAAVSPVITPGLLQANNKPTCIIYGEEDRMTPPSSLQEEIKVAGKNFQVRIVERADHFWLGQEEVLTKIVISFLQDHL